MTTESATATTQATCPWCAKPNCPDLFDHRRLAGSSEWTWIRTARKEEAVSR